MKKKIVTIVALVGIVSSLVMGCGSFRAQNEYITITQYKDLKIPEVELVKITDADVERDIESYKEVHSTLSEITSRPAQEGDVVNISLKGVLNNGEIFEDGEGDMLLNEGGPIPELVEGIIGHNVGDEFEVNATFPDTYSLNPDLAGESAVFEVKLHQISEKEYPELNDEFAKKVSKTAETVDELKAEIKERKIEEAEASAQSIRITEVMKALQKNIEIKKLPEDEVDELKTRVRGQYEQYAETNGVELAEFLAGQGINEASLQEDAEQEVAMKIAIVLIAEKEKLVPSDEEYQEKYEEMVTQYNYESVESLIESATEEVLQYSIIYGRVSEFLVEHAEEVSEEELKKEAEETAEETKGGTNADEESNVKEEDSDTKTEESDSLEEEK